MEARIVDLKTLFETEVSYRIPQFQRPYAWRKTKQWEPLWEDVRKKCESLLNAEEGGDALPHFMGAIVLQPRGHATGEVAKSLVVDGQQRLTTLQLLIRAAQDAFEGINETVRAKRLATLTLNGKNYWADDPDNETKIRQSNQNDQKAFQEAIRGTGDNQGPMRSIGEAHLYFKKEVTEWLNVQPADRLTKAKALEETLTKHLQIAAIDLDTREKPHFIFGVLNTRAETLAQSDLVKNTVMYEADVVDDAQEARSLWGMFDSNEWWREETKEGRLSRIQLDRFLNYWMVMMARREIAAERVSGEFSSFAETARPSQDIYAIACDIREAGVVYEDLEKTRKPGIETFLRRMKTMELGVVMPPLLWLYTNDVPEEKRVRSIQALESYLVRRMLCGVHSQGLNKLFVELLTNLHNNGSHSADRTIIDYLSKQTVDNRIWPNNRVLSGHLVKIPLKCTVSRQVMVLEAIEMYLRSDKTEGTETSYLTGLTREHIMPQSWGRNWPLSENNHDEEEAREARNEAVKEIGNLTLTTSKLNASLSNGPWNEKRVTLEQHTTLRLNWEMSKKAPEVWDETAIHQRSEYLAKLVTEIWPPAEDLAPASQ